MEPLDPALYQTAIQTALEEDIGAGDVTTESLQLGGRRARAEIKAKDDGIIAGLQVAADTFRALDPDVEVMFLASDGDLVRAGALLMTVSGRAADLLGAERTALNFLQRMSGIATFTFQMAKQVKGTRAKIYDTRKTTPGLRAMEKYAVRCGGGENHRIGLYDAVLLKDNHVQLAGGVGAAVRAARGHVGPDTMVEVEVETLDQVREAVDAGADRIMLDNMDLEQTEQAVALINGRAEVEVSGGVSMLTVGAIADMNVDIISVGALTHSAQALDIGMDFAPEDE